MQADPDENDVASWYLTIWEHTKTILLLVVAEAVLKLAIACAHKYQLMSDALHKTADDFLSYFFVAALAIFCVVGSVVLACQGTLAIVTIVKWIWRKLKG